MSCYSFDLRSQRSREPRLLASLPFLSFYGRMSADWKSQKKERRDERDLGSRGDEPVKGLQTLTLGVTLCVLAVAESTGAAETPTWFLALAIPVITEWIGEWR